MNHDDQNPPQKSSLKVVNFRREGGVKQSKGDKYRGIHAKIVDAMLGNHGRMPPFPAKLHRWVDHEGNSVIYEENAQGIVRLVADDHVNNMIAVYWDTCLSELDEYWGQMSADDASKVRKLWLARCPGRSKPWLALGWGDATELALHKVKETPCNFGYDFVMAPRYLELMQRMSDHKVFMAWIGSLFDPNSQRQQYVWIYGGGGNGKSAMIRAIMKYLGPVAANENPPTRDAKHWTVGLRNKRLVVFADCNNTAFVTSGEFKSLTGEDGVRMEPKGKPAYTEHIHAKFLISSNEKPSISSNKADLRRCLFFHIGEITKDFGPDYEKKLELETIYFVNSCWDVYQEMTGGNPRYTFECKNQEQIESVTSNNELEMEVFASEWIKVVDSKIYENDKDRPAISPSTMLDLMKSAGFVSKYERNRLISYLERKHQVTLKQVWKSQDERPRMFINCTVHPSRSSTYPKEKPVKTTE